MRNVITTRILPPEEWLKLTGTEIGPALAAINPDAVTIVVAEDGDGTVIGCWGLVNVAHLEGMWVHPDHRRRGVVLKRVWNHICALAAERGLGSVVTGANAPEIAQWITHRGGERLPCESFVLPLVPVGRH